MAIAISEPVAEYVSNADASSYTHGSSYTPTANSLQVIFVGATATVAASPTISGGSGWTTAPTLQPTKGTWNGGANTIYCFVGLAGASPGSFTPVFDCTGDAATGCTMSFFEITGAATSSYVVQMAAINSVIGANPTFTFGSALNTNNAYCAVICNTANPATITPPTSWTETVDSGHTSPTTGVWAGYRAGGETGTTITATKASSTHGGLAIEIAVSNPNKTIQPAVLSTPSSLQTSVRKVAKAPSTLVGTPAAQAPVPSLKKAPSVLVSSPALQAPTVHADNKQAPSVISAVSSLQAAGKTVAKALAVLSVSAVLNAPNVNITAGGTTVSVGVLTASASVQGPGKSVSKAPSALVLVAAVQAPTVHADNTQSPSTLSAVASVQACTPAVRKLPAVLAGSPGVQAPTVHADNKFSPSVLSAVSSFQSISFASAFVAAINFRDSSGYVTDDASETYCLGEGDTYPTTRGGVTFGWETINEGDMGRDRDSGIDRRLAGHNGKTNSGSQNIFRLDLPSSGDYSIRLAQGDASFDEAYQYLQIQDDTTPVLTIDDTDGTAAGFWNDATGALYSAANWPGSNSAVTGVTFSSSVLRLVLGSPSAQSNTSTIAHLYIEAEGGGSSDASISISVLNLTSALQGPGRLVCKLPATLEASSSQQAPGKAISKLPAALAISPAIQAPGKSLSISAAAQAVASALQAIGKAIAKMPSILVATPAAQAPGKEVRHSPSTGTAATSAVSPMPQISQNITVSVSALTAAASLPAIVIDISGQAGISQRTARPRLRSFGDDARARTFTGRAKARSFGEQPRARTFTGRARLRTFEGE